MNPVSPERLQRVVDLYQSGHTMSEIGGILHIGQPPIQRALKQAGVQSRKPVKRPHSDELKKSVLEYYQHGHSIADCKKEFHLTNGTVTNWTREAGIAREYYWTDADNDLLAVLYNGGLSVVECAKQCLADRSTIRKHLKQLGIQIRPHREATKRGAENGSWKGGRVDRDGYVHIRVSQGHPMYPGYILEHHLVMEQHLGRCLRSGEVVHHRNKNKKDNRLENLHLFSSNGDHLAHELAGQRPKWSEGGKKRIDAGLRKLREGQRSRRQPKIDAPQ